MDLREAILSISTIQTQLARVQVFRGYRAAPVALTGLLAFSAALWQPWLVPDPTQSIMAYLVLWVTVAVLSLGVCLVGMLLPHRWRPTLLARAATLAALEQLAPCIVVGALVTLVMVRSAPTHAVLLPGLWQLLLGLGVFASAAQLPRHAIAVGFFYLLTGTISLSLADSSAALSPWMMGIPFGAGQLLAAMILYLTLEQRDAE